MFLFRLLAAPSMRCEFRECAALLGVGTFPYDAKQTKYRRRRMLVTCGNCERDMEVSGSLSDGSLVRCPFCGETSVFSKPSRIELPPEISAQRQMETVDTAEPKMVTGNPKKPLKFVAPQKVVVSDNPDARRIMQRMEDHFRYLDELDDKVCRRKRLRKIVNCLVIVALMVCTRDVRILLAQKGEGAAG